MNIDKKTLTELDFPMMNVWIFKSAFFGFWFIFFALVFAIISFFIMAREIIFFDFVSPLLFLYFFSLFFFFLPIAILKKIEIKKFHYNIYQESLKIEQGVFHKQQTLILYKNIRSVFITQDLFDKIFNIYSIHVDLINSQAEANNYNHSIGFSGHKLIIPSLKRVSAETLKEIFLEKIKEFSS